MDQRDMSDPLESSQKMVPDLIKLDQIPDNFLQHVETDLLETSTFQEATTTASGYASFNLAQKGFLHSHSKILVGLVPSAAGQMLPANIGIASIIDRAVLKVRKSGQVINDISDFGHFHAIKSCQISNETNREREQYMTGRIMNKEFKHYFDNGATTIYDAERSLGYGLDNGREYSAKGGGGVRDVGQNGLAQPFSLMTTGAPLESPTYSIDISDLFLFMKTQSLPLYMIDQGLTLELYWSNTLSRVQRAGGASAGIAIDRNELKFVADYITYTEDDAMNRYRDANPVIDMSFSDYRLSKNTRSQVEIQNGFVRQLGMNNRVVPRVITIISNEVDGAGGPNAAAALDECLLGKYNMMAPVENTGQTNVPGTLSYNIRYKSRFEFSQALTNKAQAFTQLVQSEGLPFVSRQEYSGDQEGYLAGRNAGGALVAGAEATFQGYVQGGKAAAGAGGRRIGALAGQFFMLGTRLTNGRVGNDGVELHLTALMPDESAAQNGSTPYIVRSYLEYVRRARLENGEMEIMNA